MLSILLIAPAMYAEDGTASTDSSEQTAVEPITEEKSKLENQREIEKKVKEVFAEAPAMVSIAECESKFRQYTDGGNIFKGHGVYVGIFQINEKIHAATAKKLGFDIYTVDGNIGYAKHLYEKEGTKPWGCRSAAVQVQNSEQQSGPVVKSIDQSSFAITRNLQQGLINEQVRTLQKILNEHGFAVAAAGPGSLGNETTKYGPLTRKAVERFQCAKKITCPPEGLRLAGYGYVGPKTRAALAELLSEEGE